ncbi:hypothetical protein Hanom_Chr15g01369371 [Helianthus anomalus]
MSFQIGKTIFRQKKPHFPSPPPVKWISGTPFSLPSPPLPMLSRSLEHSVKPTESTRIDSVLFRFQKLYKQPSLFHACPTTVLFPTNLHCRCRHG